MRSAFGGLWVDWRNAADIVHGKLALGWIDEADAGILVLFIENGYVILDDALAPDVVDRAEEALDRAYRGEVAELRFECFETEQRYSAWDPAMCVHPAKALDYHWLSAEIREAIFSPALVRFLHCSSSGPSWPPRRCASSAVRPNASTRTRPTSPTRSLSSSPPRGSPSRT